MKHTLALVALIAMLLLPAQPSLVSAVGCNWVNADSDADWHSPANWDPCVPNGNDNATIRGNTGSNGIWPVVQYPTPAQPNGIWIGYDNTIGVPCLTVAYDGELTTSSISVGFVKDGCMEIKGGETTITSTLNLGTGNSFGYGHGQLDVYAGRVDIINLNFGVYQGGIHLGGTGALNLLGGSVRTFNLNNLTTPGCKINIENGILIITGSTTTTDLDTWIADGYLQAFDGQGAIQYENVGDLVIWAQAPQSALPALFEDGRVDMDDLANLTQSWLSTACAQGNQWCNDADLDGDGDVTVADYALLNNWWDLGELPGLHVTTDGTLTRQGAPYTGFGVNYFDAFYVKLQNNNNNTYLAGFDDLEDHNIQLTRMMGCGFWPVHMQLYFDDKDEYFRRFDAVIDAAEQNNIGLIVTLFWTHYTMADLVGEPVNSIGNNDSQTIAAMKQYIADVVPRYLHSPAIWGWEICNEWSNAVDLPNAEDHRPPTHTGYGNPSFRTERDELNHEMMFSALKTLATEIRKYDPYRLISSGHSFPRLSAWHQWQELSWTHDTTAQRRLMFKLNNPDPINCLSVHFYDLTEDDVDVAQSVAASVNKVLFVGEFGARGYTTETETAFYTILNEIQNSGAAIATVWVYNRQLVDDWIIYADPFSGRYYQLQAIAAANGN